MSATTANIGIRMILGLSLGLIGGVFAFVESTATALSDNNPALALTINGDNEIAAQRMANLHMKNIDDQKSLQSAKALTLAALENAPGLAPSIRNFALLSELKVLDGNTDDLMQMATKFSRRDLPTQLWLIEKEVQGGDAAKTLAVYDLAMTSNPEIREILFPILANGVTDSELVGPIAKVLKTEPTWAPAFYAHFYENETVLGNFLYLLNALGPDSERLIPIGIRGSLANSLIKKGEWDAAYQTSLLGIKSIKVSDFGNDKERISPPFGWSYVPSGTVGYSVGNDNILSVKAGRGAGTTIAARVVRLPSDSFKFVATITSADANLDQVPRFALSCMDKQSVEQRLSPKSIGKGKFSISENLYFSNCKFAKIYIILPSNFSGPDFTASIHGVDLI